MKVNDKARVKIEEIIIAMKDGYVSEVDGHNRISTILTGKGLNGFYGNKPHADIMVIEPTESHDSWLCMIFLNDLAFQYIKALRGIRRSEVDEWLEDRGAVDDILNDIYMPALISGIDINTRMISNISRKITIKHIEYPHSVEMVVLFMVRCERLLKAIFQAGHDLIYRQATRALDDVIEDIELQSMIERDRDRRLRDIEYHQDTSVNMEEVEG